jgi:hypothetical protein
LLIHAVVALAASTASLLLKTEQSAPFLLVSVQLSVSEAAPLAADWLGS